ncbi:hypothetical protein VTL71DRAFT_3702 [Oculimacula yallundae]|uniref:Uncharacterized protein n=1 Tax=Oculimacula yallundae TaxID=86028 RepID=A0ABR4C3T1_9HELO
MSAAGNPVAPVNNSTTVTPRSSSDPILPSPKNLLWESVEKLSKVDDRYAALLTQKEIVVDQNHRYGTVKVFKLGQHISGPLKGKRVIEETYNSKEPHPNTLDVNELLQKGGSELQILVHTFDSESISARDTSRSYRVREKFNLDLLVRVGDEYAIDPELLLMAGLDASKLKTFPVRRGVFRMLIPPDGLTSSDTRYYELATHVCLNKTDPTRCLVIILLAEDRLMSLTGWGRISFFRQTYPHIEPRGLLAIEWVRSFFLSLEDASSHPVWMEHLFTWFFTRMSPEDVYAAESDCRHLIAGCVQALLTFHLDDLQVYESHAAEARSNPSDLFVQNRNESSQSRFELQLRLIQDLEENARAFFEGLKPNNILQDIQFLRRRYERRDETLRAQASYDASMASLEESRIGIQQNASVKTLTQLAFVFIPLSFVTSVFGMNVDVLSGDGAKWWTVFVGIAIVYTVVNWGLVWLRLEHVRMFIREKKNNWRARKARKQRKKHGLEDA